MTFFDHNPTPRRPGAFLAQDRRGATLVEFGLLMPVMGMLLVGTFDIGHTLYLKAVLQGELQKSARDSGLETGSYAATQAALDTRIRDQVHRLGKSSNVTITRRSYRSFSKAAAAQSEPFTDQNANSQCDNGEPYEDQNGNGVRDLDGGNAGQGGAKDSVLLTVKVSYARLFPLHKFISVSDTVNLEAKTVMNNQPYGEQGSDTPATRNCT